MLRRFLNHMPRLKFAVPFIVLSMFSVRPVAAVTATWQSAANGFWSTASNWSSAPNYPNNGTPAGTTYDAQIQASGGPYTVTLGSIAVNNLTVGSGATLQFPLSGGGTLSISQTMSLLNGSEFLLNDGNVSGGTINGTGSAIITAAVDDLFINTFTNVTLNAHLQIPDESTVIFSGNTQLGSNAVVELDGQQNSLELSALLAGHGEILFDGQLSDEFGNITALNPGSNITFGSGITVATGTANGQIPNAINDGTMLAQNGRTLQVNLVDNRGSILATTGGIINISATSWTNEGSIAANGGTIRSPVPTGSQGGTFSVHNGTFDMAGTSTVAAVDSLDIQNSNIEIDLFGRINNTGATLNVLDGTNTWQLAGTISGGIVAGPGAIPLEILFQNENSNASKSALNGVQLSTGLKMDSGAYLTLESGTSITNQKLEMIGGLNSPQKRQTTLVFDTTVSLSNNTTIEFDNTTQNNLICSSIPSGAVVTTSTGGGTISNAQDSLTIAGKVMALTANEPITLQAATITNHGTLIASGDSVQIPEFASETTDRLIPVAFTSDGTVDLQEGGLLNIAGTFDQLTAGVAQFELGGTNSTAYGLLTTTGNIQLDGELLITLAPGYQPSIGQQFEIINTSGGNLSGTFSNSIFQTSGQQFLVTYNPTNVTLTVVPEPENAALSLFFSAAGLLASRRPSRNHSRGRKSSTEI